MPHIFGDGRYGRRPSNIPFERDQLWARRDRARRAAVEVCGVVVGEGHLFAAPALRLPSNHRAWFNSSDTRTQPGSRAAAAPCSPLDICPELNSNAASGCRAVGQLALQHDVVVVGAGDFAGTAAPRRHGRSRVHRRSTSWCWPMQHNSRWRTTTSPRGQPVRVIVHRSREMHGSLSRSARRDNRPLAPAIHRAAVGKSLVIITPLIR